MKKILLSIILICVLSFVVSATSENSYVYEYPEQNITVMFTETSVLTHDERQMIADSIVYNIHVPQTYSLCWLLGHKLYTETVSLVYHEKATYDPRCQLEVYDVEKCENCDYAYPILVSSSYISCCPPDASAVSIDGSHTH